MRLARLVVLAGLAALVAPAWAQVPDGAPASVQPVAVSGETQRVTIYVRGLPSGFTASVQRGDGPAVAMSDPGLGVLAAELEGPAANFLPLRISVGRGGDTWMLYDGLVVLADVRHETIAFQYQDQQLLRLPISPSARTEVALDQRVTWWVAFGWGALSLGWLGVVGVVWAIRSR